MTTPTDSSPRLTKNSALIFAAFLIVIGLFTPRDRTYCSFVSPSAWQCTTSSPSQVHRILGRVSSSRGQVDFGEDALGQPRPANIRVHGIGVMGFGSYAAQSVAPSPEYTLPQRVFERSAQHDADRLIRFIDREEYDGFFEGTNYAIILYAAAIIWLLIGGRIVQRNRRDG